MSDTEPDYLDQHTHYPDGGQHEADGCVICAIRAQTKRLEALVAKLEGQRTVEPLLRGATRCAALNDRFRCDLPEGHAEGHSATVGSRTLLWWT